MGREEAGFGSEEVCRNLSGDQDRKHLRVLEGNSCRHLPAAKMRLSIQDDLQLLLSSCGNVHVVGDVDVTGVPACHRRGRQLLRC